VSIRRTEAHFEGAGRCSPFRRAWIPDAPARLLVVVHGFAEHTGRYEEFGTWFADESCAVHAFDLRGHGRSEGRRNHVDRFDDFLEDTARLLALARGEHPDLPTFLVGHSMGGLIATAFTRERAPEIDALVTSGAALLPSVSPVRARLARWVRKVAPRFSLDAGLPVDGLSRDPEVARKYVADPLIETSMTVSLGAEMLDAVARTARGGAAIGVPMLLLHGGADPLCAPGGSEAFFASLAGDVRAASGLKVYPELLHEIFNEPEKHEVFRDALTWMQGVEASGVAGSAAAAGAPSP